MTAPEDDECEVDPVRGPLGATLRESVHDALLGIYLGSDHRVAYRTLVPGVRSGACTGRGPMIRDDVVVE